MNQLHEKFAGQGFNIIAQPCNQFGAQEPKKGPELLDHLRAQAWAPKFPAENFFERRNVNRPDAWIFKKPVVSSLSANVLDKGVNDPETSELYQFLQNHENCQGQVEFRGREFEDPKIIKWNFTKFLVGKDGVPIKRYAPSVTPLEIEADIKAALAVKLSEPL